MKPNFKKAFTFAILLPVFIYVVSWVIMADPLIANWTDKERFISGVFIGIFSVMGFIIGLCWDEITKKYN